MDVDLVAGGLAGGGVQGEVMVAEKAGFLLAHFAGKALHAGNELQGAVGFGHVVIGPMGKALELGRSDILTAKHDDAHIGEAPAQGIAEGNAVAIGEVDIEEGDGDISGFQNGQGVLHGVGSAHNIVRAEQGAEGDEGIVVVFYDQRFQGVV